jgi:hypothetical protein
MISKLITVPLGGSPLRSVTEILHRSVAWAGSSESRVEVGHAQMDRHLGGHHRAHGFEGELVGALCWEVVQDAMRAATVYE